MSLLVEPVSQPQIVAWQVSPDNAQDVMIAMSVAMGLGYKAKVDPFVQPNTVDPSTGLPVVIWTVVISYPGAKDMVAYNTGWIVCDGQKISVHTNDEFVSRFTADVPLVWDGAAPAVEALPSDQVALTFPQPTSPNGPFTYTAEADDATDSSAAALNVVEQVVENGQVTLKGDGLITGHEYTFTVTVATPYEHTATSVPSQAVTAIL